jgi:phage major tail protein, TP901-1 family
MVSKQKYERWYKTMKRYIPQIFASTKTENFTGDGTKKVFTLSATPTAITSVTVAGTALATSAYSFAGTALTLTTAPESDATVVVVYTTATFEDYCNFDANSASATAGKDLLLAIWNAEGTAILALGGQQSLKINRSADTVEVTSKDTDGGWKSFIGGMKEWSIDTGGIYVASDESHKILSKAFEDGSPVCIKVYNNKTKKGMFGGLGCITDYPVDAPYDDSVTYSMTFKGMGALVDLTLNPVANEKLPE